MALWSYLKKYVKSYRAQRSASGTVRFMFPALLSGAAVFGLMSLSAVTEDSFVYLETSTKAVEVGDVFPVVVYASAAIPINAVELQIDFPADKLSVFGVDRGQSVITIWTEDPVITGQSVLMRGGTFKRGFLGEHQIATINFRAEKTGQYKISTNDVRFIAGDGEGTEVPAAAVPATNLAMFNFDENTSEEEIKVAISEKINTDLNGDGKITLQDISAFMGAWSNKSQSHDFNGDGRMTFKDFSIILAEYFFQ